MGDVKLAGVMGLFLGPRGRPGDLRRAGRRHARRRADHGPQGRRRRAARRQVPFGPFLAFGGLVGLFAGDAIVDWYLDTFDCSPRWGLDPTPRLKCALAGADKPGEMKAVNLLPTDLRGTPKSASPKPTSATADDEPGGSAPSSCSARSPLRRGARRLRAGGQHDQGPRGRARRGDGPGRRPPAQRRQAEALRGLRGARRRRASRPCRTSRPALRLGAGAPRHLPRHPGRRDAHRAQRHDLQRRRRRRLGHAQRDRRPGHRAQGLHRPARRDVATPDGPPAQHRRRDPRELAKSEQGRRRAPDAPPPARPTGATGGAAGCGPGNPPQFEMVMFFERSRPPRPSQDIAVQPSAGAAAADRAPPRRGRSRPARRLGDAPADPAGAGTATPRRRPAGRGRPVTGTNKILIAVVAARPRRSPRTTSWSSRPSARRSPSSTARSPPSRPRSPRRSRPSPPTRGRARRLQDQLRHGRPPRQGRARRRRRALADGPARNSAADAAASTSRTISSAAACRRRRPATRRGTAAPAASSPPPGRGAVGRRRASAMPFSSRFTGGFFDLSNFFAKLEHFVDRQQQARRRDRPPAAAGERLDRARRARLPGHAAPRSAPAPTSCRRSQGVTGGAAPPAPPDAGPTPATPPTHGHVPRPPRPPEPRDERPRRPPGASWCAAGCGRCRAAGRRAGRGPGPPGRGAEPGRRPGRRRRPPSRRRPTTRRRAGRRAGRRRRTAPSPPRARRPQGPVRAGPRQEAEGGQDGRARRPSDRRPRPSAPAAACRRPATRAPSTPAPIAHAHAGEAEEDVPAVLAERPLRRRRRPDTLPERKRRASSTPLPDGRRAAARLHGPDRRTARRRCSWSTTALDAEGDGSCKPAPDATCETIELRRRRHRVLRRRSTPRRGDEVTRAVRARPRRHQAHLRSRRQVKASRCPLAPAGSGPLGAAAELPSRFIGSPA